MRPEMATKSNGGHSGGHWSPAAETTQGRGVHLGKTLDTDATEWFIDAARGHWLYPILVFAAATGCRRDEILALK
jgi:integrase